MASSRIFDKAFIRKMVLLSGVMLVMGSVPAMAGFEWKGPAPSAKAKDADAKNDIDMQGLAPITWDGPGSAMPPQKVPHVETSPVEFETLPGAPAMLPPLSSSVSATATTEPGEIISGFGHDLPLVMALQQVAPAGYQFAFAPGVDAGQNVSWDGGRGWKTVMSDMLASKGLSYEAHDKVLRITRGGPASAVPVKDVQPTLQTIRVTPPPLPESRIQPAPPQAAAQTGEVITIRRQKPMVPRPPQAETPPAPLPMAAPMTEPVVPAPLAMAAMTPPPAAPLPPPALPAAEALTAEETAPIALMPIEAPEPKPLPPVSDVKDVAPVAPVTAAFVPQEKPKVKESKQGWHATRGALLRQTLESWAEQADVQLYWSIDYDYKIPQAIDMKGDFSVAVRRLLDLFDKAKPQPYGQLYQNSKSSDVLVIKAYEE